jgi:hypothetical protein
MIETLVVFDSVNAQLLEIGIAAAVWHIAHA